MNQLVREIIRTLVLRGIFCLGVRALFPETHTHTHTAASFRRPFPVVVSNDVDVIKDRQVLELVNELDERRFVHEMQRWGRGVPC